MVLEFVSGPRSQAVFSGVAWNESVRSGDMHSLPSNAPVPSGLADGPGMASPAIYRRIRGLRNHYVRQADPVHHRAVPRIGAESIQHVPTSDPGDRIGAILVLALEPIEGTVLVTESQMDPGKRMRRNVTLAGKLCQFLQEFLGWRQHVQGASFDAALSSRVRSRLFPAKKSWDPTPPTTTTKYTFRNAKSWQNGSATT